MKQNMKTKGTMLCALLLLLAMGTAVSCGSSESGNHEKNDGTGDANGQQTQAETASDTELPNDRPALNLPDADYNGEAFRILEYDIVDCVHHYDFYYDQNSAGELINDAVYARNLLIEDRYNCKIDVTNNNAPIPVARNSISAGSDDFDVMELYINNAMSMAMEGMFQNWYDLPHIAFGESWWDQAIQRDLSMFNKIYVMTGDISIYDEELNYCVYFNKKVAVDFDMPDFYQMARDKKWTIDTMQEYGKTVSADLNGDGVRDENDRFGILSDGGMLWLFYFTSGCNYVTLDENGEPHFTVESERGVSVCNRLTELFNDKDTMLWAGKCSDTWKTLDKVFMENRNLFRPGSIYDIIYYRNMEHDFGILPYPLYDENQDNYYHPIATQVCPGLCIPTTNGNVDKTALLLEALAYESRDTVTKAYYDLNLYTKMARDDESGEMLDIIFSTKRYDLGFVFDWGALTSQLQNMANSKKSLTTIWDACKKKAESKMQETLDYYRSNET